MKNKIFKIIGILVLVEISLRAIYFSNVREGKVTLNSSLWNNSIFSMGPLNPNSNWVARYNIIPFRVHSNNFGMRTNRDVPLLKGSNEYRILVLGDSFTFSEKVHQEHTYPALLEKYLMNFYSKKGFNKDIQVYNAGKPGTGAFYQYHLLKGIYNSIKPDLVILTFYQNDIEDTKREAQNLAELHNLTQNSSYIRLQDILRRSAVFQSLTEFMAFCLIKSEIYKPKAPIKTQVTEKDSILFKEYTSKLISFAKEHHTSFLYVFAPHSNEVLGKYGEHITFTERFLKENKIPYLPNRHFPQQLSDLELTLFPMDSHLSREGNIMFAQSVFQKIVDTNFIQ